MPLKKWGGGSCITEKDSYTRNLITIFFVTNSAVNHQPEEAENQDTDCRNQPKDKTAHSAYDKFGFLTIFVKHYIITALHLTVINSYGSVLSCSRAQHRSHSE